MINLKQFDDAGSSLKKSLEFSPKNAETWNSLAKIYVERDNDLEKALQYINKGLIHDPNNFNCLFNKCNLQFKLNKIAEAHETHMKINKNIIPNIQFDSYLIIKGEILFRLGNFEDAKKIFLTLKGSEHIDLQLITLYLKACEITIKQGGYNATNGSV